MGNFNRRTWLGAMAALSVARGATAAELQVPLAFEELPLAVADRSDGKVEVIEFFWYGCPHCYSLEPSMNKWLAEAMPENVVFVREAPPLNPSWQAHSRAFYSARQMGVVEEFHEPFFDAIHKDRNQKLREGNEDEIVAFAESRGIDGKKFRSMMSSFMVDGAMRNAMTLAAKYRLTGVPSMMVAGKYKTSGQLAGSYEVMLEAITDLSTQLGK